MGSSSLRTRRGQASGQRSEGSGARSPIVDPANFLLATRDTGYKTTALAIAELVDNSIQAGSSRVAINVSPSDDGEFPVEVVVVDDGTGMDPETLGRSLTFGGSTRFGDRSSLGRYGMGLPNGALSRARRVEVFSWSRETVSMAFLDLDEFLATRRRSLPPVRQVERPTFLPDWPRGTAVRLRRCDRLEYRRPSTIARHIASELGRIYFEFLCSGLELTVNDQPVDPTDPLMLRGSGGQAGVRQFGEPLRYRLEAAGADDGVVEVRFSELPVARWSGMSTADKRRMGVTSAPTVSVLRAGREIDRGWFFMGGKRRENYDDWWRCEVRFEPALDELFGITHAKQAISPTRELLELLSNDMEPIARALNGRVRRRFELVKLSTPLSSAAAAASRAEASLPPLPSSSERFSSAVSEVLATLDDLALVEGNCRLALAELPSTSVFEAVVADGVLTVALNSRHSVFREVYQPLAVSDLSADHATAQRLLLTILAAARAQYMDGIGVSRRQGERFRQAWSDVLATYLDAQ